MCWFRALPLCVEGLQDLVAKVAREHLLEGFSEEAQLEGGLIAILHSVKVA